MNLKGEYTLIKDSLIYDFFAHPMRIYYIFAGILAIFGALVLIFRIGDFISFHQFIFLELFCAAAFCGFLFTAVPDWANYKKSLMSYSISGFVILILALISQILGFNGHIFIAIKNEGTKELVIKKGDHFAQGIFTKFLTVDNEEEVTATRQGGFGSTN